ncbi:hypothetical protein GCK32_011932 [Trichostrongylus colubriformis]|uniref:Uncharacterized protein n=1 Tax=Trichostrongylus colubriformis TaxID=6319 RepID=A0AAN8FF64_TRICO
MRNTCILCLQKAITSTMQRASVSKRTNLIIAASLSMLGYVDREDVDKVVETISNNSRWICQSHVVYAAQYICAEMVAIGKNFSYYCNPSAKGSTAYVSSEDIPPHLVGIINGMSNGSVVITAGDLLTFVNTALKRYHGTSLWPQHSGQEEGMEENKSCADPEESSPLFKVVPKVEEGSRNSEEGVDAMNGIHYGAISPKKEVSECDPASDEVEHSSGKILFCPQCGHQMISKAQ